LCDRGEWVHRFMAGQAVAGEGLHCPGHNPHSWCASLNLLECALLQQGV
jgi:hypothetical protein